MDFAVVIPAFNSSDTIVGAAESALSQRLAKEVIVVDDGSSDDTPTAARSMTDPRVIVLEQSNAGPGAARNTGAEAATATHIVFLDADDRLTGDALDRFAGAGDHELIRAGTTRHNIDGSESTVLARPDPRPAPRGAPHAGSFAISTELFRRIGGYDVRFRFGENSELLWRAQQTMRREGNETSFIGSPTIVYTQREGDRSAEYRSRRLAAIDLVLTKYADDLRADEEMARNYHTIAAVLHRRDGHRRRAMRSAARAVRVDPRVARSWARLAQVTFARTGSR